MKFKEIQKEIKQKIAAEWAELKEVLEPMTRKQRIEHLFTYYSFLLIPVVVLLVVIVLIIGVTSAKDTVFTGFGLNVNLTEAATAYVTDEWLQSEGYNTKEHKAVFSYLDGSSGYPDVIVSSEAYTSVAAHVSAQALDYLILDEATLPELNTLMCGDLTQLLSQQQLTELEDYFIEVTAEGVTYPGVIDITHTDFATTCSAKGEKVYLMFLSNTLHADACDDFLDYLLDWQG